MGDIVYVNVELNQSSGEYRQPLAGSVSRTSAIIDRVGDYYCAVARLTAPLNLPLWLPEMQLGPGSAPGFANTVYHVSLNYTDTTPTNTFYTAPLRIARAEGNYTVQPNDLSNAIYTKQAIATMFNNAFSRAFARLLADQPDLEGVLEPPKFIYNENNDTFDIYLWQAGYYTSLVGFEQKHINIFFSATLNNYLSGFNVNIRNYQAGQSDPTKYNDIQLLITNLSYIEGFSRSTENAFIADSAHPETQINYRSLNKPMSSTPYTAMYDNGNDGVNMFTPFYSSPPVLTLSMMGGFGGWFGAIAIIANTVPNSATDRFNAVNCVRVISSGLCQNEELSAAILPGGRVSTSPSSSSLSVLQDFIPDRTPGWSQRMLLYTADSIITGARYVDMSGNNALIHFTISLEWLDVWGVSRPLYSLSNSNNSSVKLAFVSKSLFRK